MVDNIITYTGITLFFSLLFLAVTALLEPHRVRLLQLSGKISWKTVQQFFYLWIAILVLRKVLYYLPFEGVIQTPSSVWWVEKNVLILLYVLFIFFLLAVWAIVIVIRARDKNSEISAIHFDFIYGGAFVCFITSVFAYVYFGFFFNDLPAYQIVISPLLVLKMFCTGKYTGLLVSFGVVYFLFFRYKKIEPGINSSFKKFLIALVLIIIAFGIFIYDKFPGDKEERLLHKVHTAKNELAIEDLLDALETITDDEERIEIFKKVAIEAGNTKDKKPYKYVLLGFVEAIAASGKSDNIKFTYLKKILEAIEITNQKNVFATNEIFQGIIHLAQTMKTTEHKSDAIRKIILTIVKTREVETAKELSQQAIDVVQTMHPRIRYDVFKKIAAAVAGTAGKKWATVIFMQLIHAIETVTDNGWVKYNILRGVLSEVSSRSDMNEEKEIFTAAVNTANTISYWRNRSLALQAAAAAIKNTGNLKWAESVARQIPDTEIRDYTLKKILHR